MSNRIHIAKNYFVFVSESSIAVLDKAHGSTTKHEHQFREIENVKLAEKVVDFSMFSPKEDYFVCVYSDKVITLWDTSGEKTWTKVGDIVAVRRSVCVCFNSAEDSLFVADKSGDLYNYKIEDIKCEESPSEDKEKEPILGHVSMLLDVAATDKYIITADRDEKIRVSFMEPPHAVQSFCLSHTEFITRILVSQSGSALVSFSGDGTMRTWKMDSGQLVQTVRLFDNSNESTVEAKLVPDVISINSAGNLVAVSASGTSQVRVYSFDEHSDGEQLKLVYEIDLPGEKQVFDACFDSWENTENSLFILTTTSDGKPNCIVASCQNDFISLSETDTVARCANDLMGASTNFCMKKRDFSQHFRLKIEGNVYEAFKRKKQHQQHAIKKQKVSAAS